MRVRVHYTHEARREHPCPVCGAVLSQATNVVEDESSGPEPGAVVLCIGCGHPSIFTPDMLLRRLTASELSAACQQPVFLRTHLSMLSKRRTYARRVCMDDEQ
jgi:hypothetical protein